MKKDKAILVKLADHIHYTMAHECLSRGMSMAEFVRIATHEKLIRDNVGVKIRPKKQVIDEPLA